MMLDSIPLETVALAIIHEETNRSHEKFSI